MDDDRGRGEGDEEVRMSQDCVALPPCSLPPTIENTVYFWWEEGAWGRS